MSAYRKSGPILTLEKDGKKKKWFDDIAGAYQTKIMSELMRADKKDGCGSRYETYEQLSTRIGSILKDLADEIEREVLHGVEDETWKAIQEGRRDYGNDIDGNGN